MRNSPPAPGGDAPSSEKATTSAATPAAPTATMTARKGLFLHTIRTGTAVTSPTPNAGNGLTAGNHWSVPITSAGSPSTTTGMVHVITSTGSPCTTGAAGRVSSNGSDGRARRNACRSPPPPIRVGHRR